MFSGTIGHVAHGKSTVVKAISGVQVKTCFILNLIVLSVLDVLLRMPCIDVDSENDLPHCDYDC